jgi:hypothetical protein
LQLLAANIIGFVVKKKDEGEVVLTKTHLHKQEIILSKLATEPNMIKTS